MTIQLHGVTKMKSMRTRELQEYVQELRTRKQNLELEQQSGYDVGFALKNIKKSLKDAELVLMGGEFGDIKRERAKKKNSVNGKQRRDVRNQKHNYE